MDKYRSLVVWQRAHQLVSLVLDATEGQSPPRTWALFDQVRRAAISIEERGYLSAGVVERLRAVLDGLLAALFGLMRKLRA